MGGIIEPGREIVTEFDRHERIIGRGMTPHRQGKEILVHAVGGECLPLRRDRSRAGAIVIVACAECVFQECVQSVAVRIDRGITCETLRIR